MQFMFEAAREQLNTATRVAEHITGKAADSETKVYATIHVGLGILTGPRGPKPGDNVESRVMNDLVVEYFKAHLPDAMDYALAELQKRYNHALLGSKAQLEDYLAQVKALEDDPATDSPVVDNPVHVLVDQ